MKDSCNEEILSDLKKQRNNNIFLECLRTSNSLKYLDKEDIINLSKCNKSTYNSVNENNFLFRNLLLTSHAP
jgi:uncharacterized protein YehS (DUF1456 family)